MAGHHVTRISAVLRDYSEQLDKDLRAPSVVV